MEIRKILKEELEKALQESSVSRIWQFVESPTGTFGVMSSNRGEYSKEQNNQRHIELKTLVRGMGLGFIELKGGFMEEGGFVEEISLFIPNISKEEIVNLGIKFDQYTILFKNEIEFVAIGTNKNSGINKVLDSFKFNANKENFSLDPNLFKSFYSKLLKGNHQDKKFLFNMNEMILSERERLTFSEASSSKRKSDEERWVVIN